MLSSDASSGARRVEPRAAKVAPAGQEDRTTNHFERSLLAYALAGGAAASGASGAIVYSGTQDQSMALTLGNSLAIDLDGDSSDDFTLRYVDSNTSDANEPYQLQVVPASDASVVKITSSVAAALSAGDTIGSGSNWGGNGTSKILAEFAVADGAGGNEWAGLSNRYLGGRIETASGSGQFIHGWMQLSVPGNALDGADPTTVTVHDWAYETTVDQSILAGSIVAVPGGGAFALFSLGATGLGRWRTRQRTR